MRIAFIVRRFPVLSESFILSQIAGCLEAGHEVEIFAEGDSKEKVVHDIVTKYSLSERTHYISDIPRNKIQCRLKTAMLVLAGMFKDPVRLIKALKFNLSRPDGFSYHEMYFALKFLGKRFDLLQCHFGRAGNVGAFLKQAGFGFTVVTAFHGYDVTSYVNKFGIDIYRRLFKVGDMFTYNSEATKQKLLELGAPAEKMAKIPMGIDTDKIPFRERKIGPDNIIRILSVGRLVEMKGREYAIKAISRLSKKYDNLHYTIVGDGPLRDSLVRLSEELGISDKVYFAGWVDDKELERLYRTSHLFLHPSVVASDGNMEGQGVVLLEAQAHGLPIAATRHNAFVETVLDGKSGILVPERDEEALADAIEMLIRNPEKWPEMGMCGREHAERHYDIKVLNRQLLDLFQNLQCKKEAKKSGPS